MVGIDGKTLLDGLEVDIAIPVLKLAIEWNGIVHFKPIYGKTKLARIKQIDAQKQKVAQEKGVSLIVISDVVSNQTKLEEATLEVSSIISQLLN